MVDDQAIKAAEDRGCSSDKRLAVFGGGEVLLQRAADVFAAAYADEIRSALRFGAVAEDNLRSRLVEEPDRRGADAARTASDEGDFAREVEVEKARLRVLRLRVLGCWLRWLAFQA